MEYKPVLTKHDFVKRYLKHEFGNMSPSWGTIGEFLEDCHKFQDDLIHIRNRQAGGDTWYDIKPRNVAGLWERIMRGAITADNLYISLMAPTDKTLIQGEVQQGTTGIEIYVTTVAKPMREALVQRGESSNGIVALTTLKHFLCPNSMEWMYVLLDRYPEHVVEFSTYTKCWGTLPNYNTVFWEIRKGY